MGRNQIFIIIIILYSFWQPNRHMQVWESHVVYICLCILDGVTVSFLFWLKKCFAFVETVSCSKWKAPRGNITQITVWVWSPLGTACTFVAMLWFWKNMHKSSARLTFSTFHFMSIRCTLGSSIHLVLYNCVCDFDKTSTFKQHFARLSGNFCL